MKLYGANPEWLAQHGLRAADARRLLRALSTLADYEGPITAALKNDPWALSNVCTALRYLVDGPDA